MCVLESAKIGKVMSSLSLPRLLNGGGNSNNRTFNWKFGSSKSATLPTKRQQLTTDINNNSNINKISNNNVGGTGNKFVPPIPTARRKQLLNRRGSLHHNQFKGVKKEFIEKNAMLIMHTMTVCLYIFVKFS